MADVIDELAVSLEIEPWTATIVGVEVTAASAPLDALVGLSFRGLRRRLPELFPADAARRSLCLQRARRPRRRLPRVGLREPAGRARRDDARPRGARGANPRRRLHRVGGRRTGDRDDSGDRTARGADRTGRTRRSRVTIHSVGTTVLPLSPDVGAPPASYGCPKLLQPTTNCARRAPLPRFVRRCRRRAGHARVSRRARCSTMPAGSSRSTSTRACSPGASARVRP